MTSVGECPHHHWQSCFDSEGFMYEEVCVSCGKRRMAKEPRYTTDSIDQSKEPTQVVTFTFDFRTTDKNV